MKKNMEAPTLEWFRSLAAIADAITALESQCLATGYGVVADKLRIAKAEIAAAADIIQTQAYGELELEADADTGTTTTKH